MSDTLSVLKQLFAAYPNTQVERQTVAVYLRALQNVSAADLQVVVDQCVVECKFLPTISELMERYRSLTRVPLLDVTEAWNQVQREIRRVGSWGAPYFADPLIAKVVASLGWRELCMSENVVADRAHFARMYNDLAQRAEQEDRLLPQARELAGKAQPLLPLRKLLGAQ